MPGPDDPEVLESNRQAADSIAMICANFPGAEIVHMPGVLAAWCNTPSSIFNGLFLTHPVEDLADLRGRVHTIAEYLQPKQMPPLLLVCREWMPEALRGEANRLLAGAGLFPSMTQTGMAANELPPPRRPAPPEIEWRRICNQETRDQLTAINARARGREPNGRTGPLSSPHIWTDQIAGCIGLVNGEPATTASAMTLNNALHIVAVATIPAYQRRGYAEAAVRRAMREMPRARITLHASDEGLPVYLRMGYHATATFTGYSRLPTYVNSFFETRVEQLFALADVVERAFASAGLEYRVVGGLAAYLYVEEREPDAGRLTKDIDILVRREDLAMIAKAAAPFGLEYRQVAGVDMLVQKDEPSARRAVHMIFSGEKVREEYGESAPAIGACRVLQGIRLTPVEDLLRMKLTSFRSKDETHVKDMDEAGIITPEIEATLSPLQRERLHMTRARR